MQGNTFYYFAYGSNLLKDRIQLMNTSATFQTIGRLDGYQLDFDLKNDYWHGCVANIVEQAGEGQS